MKASIGIIRTKLIINTYEAKQTTLAIFVVIAFISVGILLLANSRAATYAVIAEAENGQTLGNISSVSGNAASGASNGSSVKFGSGLALPAPGGLKVFTGGTSIALRWDGVVPASGSIKQYNILRNGLKIASVTPGFHADFPEKDGNGYIDGAVSKGTTYSYQVQAVSDSGVASQPSTSISVKHPTSSTPVPTISYDLGGASDLDGYIKNTVIPFLQIWYPKIADYMAFPDYTPNTTLKLVLSSSLPDILSTSRATGTISANTDFVRDEYLTSPDHILGGWLHEATHAIQGSKPGVKNDAQKMIIEGGADFAREYILHDRNPVTPTTNDYYSDGYSPSSYFINWIQQRYDSAYLRKATIAGYNATSTAQYFTFANGGKVIDELWAEMLGIPSTTGPFKSVANVNMCIDDKDSLTVNGNNIQVYACSGGSNQKLTAHMNDDSTQSLVLYGFCLDVNNSSTANGAIVWLYGCNASAAQKWKLRPDKTIVNPNSGKCLQVNGGSGAVVNGGQIGIGDCVGSAWQKWNVPAGTATISN